MNRNTLNLGNYRYNEHSIVTSLDEVGIDGKAFHVPQSTAKERMVYDQAKKDFFSIPAGYIIGPVINGKAPCNTSEELQLYKWPGGKVKFADVLVDALENMRESRTIDACLRAIKIGGDEGRKYVARLQKCDHIPNIIENIDALLFIMKETNTTEGMHTDLKDIYNKNGGIELLNHRLTGLTEKEITEIITSKRETTLQCAIRETLEETGYKMLPQPQPVARVYEYKDVHGAVVVKEADVFVELTGTSRNSKRKPQQVIMTESEKSQLLKSNLLTIEEFHTGLRKGLERKFGIEKYTWENPGDQKRKMSGQIRNLLFTQAYEIAVESGQI